MNSNTAKQPKVKALIRKDGRIAIAVRRLGDKFRVVAINRPTLKRLQAQAGVLLRSKRQALHVRKYVKPGDEQKLAACDAQIKQADDRLAKLRSYLQTIQSSEFMPYAA